MLPYALSSNCRTRYYSPRKLKGMKYLTPKPKSTTSSSKIARRVNSKKKPQNSSWNKTPKEQTNLPPMNTTAVWKTYNWSSEISHRTTSNLQTWLVLSIWTHPDGPDICMERNAKKIMKKGTSATQKLLKEARWNLLREKEEPKRAGNSNLQNIPTKRLPQNPSSSQDCPCKKKGSPTSTPAWIKGD